MAALPQALHTEGAAWLMASWVFAAMEAARGFCATASGGFVVILFFILACELCLVKILENQRLF